MAKRLSEHLKPPRAALEIIMRYLHRVARPTYLGFVAAEVRYSLERTEEMMEDLAEAGRVRRLTEAEKKQMDFRHDANVWILVETPHPGKASW